MIINKFLMNLLKDIKLYRVVVMVKNGFCGNIIFW